MTSTRISTALRAMVRQRAAGRCEYCLVHEDDPLLPHEPDHVIAEQHGGSLRVEERPEGGVRAVFELPAGEGS